MNTASSAPAEHTATVTPVGTTGVATVNCTCGWAASNGAMLTIAGAERVASIHTGRA